VRRRLQSGFGVLLLVICIGAPIAEMFDRWDDTAQTGNDTEATLVLVAVCIGVGFVAAASICRGMQPATAVRLVLLRPFVSLNAIVVHCFNAPIPNSRPPTVLRI
jgi:hypothetical protein